MFCPYCGYNLIQDEGICPQCGKSYDLKSLRSPQPPPASSPEPEILSPPPVSGYQVPPPSYASPLDKPSGLAIATLITGILSLLCCCVPAILPIILGIVEIIQIRNGQSSQKGYSYAMAGLILGVVGILFSILGFIFFMGLNPFPFHSMNFRHW